MIPSPGRGPSDQRLTARVAPGINLGVVQQGKKIFGYLTLKYFGIELVKTEKTSKKILTNISKLK